MAKRHGLTKSVYVKGNFPSKINTENLLTKVNNANENGIGKTVVLAVHNSEDGGEIFAVAFDENIAGAVLQLSNVIDSFDDSIAEALSLVKDV